MKNLWWVTIIIIVSLAGCTQNSENSEKSENPKKEISGCYECEKVKEKIANDANDADRLLESLYPGGCIYNKLEFKGESTVIVYSNLMMSEGFTTSYVRDGEYIRVTTDKSDLLIKIADENTLIGEGFAKGIYRKSDCQSKK
jgi:hypothetical protein